MGNQLLIRWAQKKIGGTLQASSIQLSWLKGQRVDELFFQNEKLSLSAQSLSSTSSLLQLILRRDQIGRTHLHHLEMNVHEHVQEVEQAGEKTPPKAQKRQRRRWSPLKGELILTEGKLIGADGSCLEELNLQLLMGREPHLAFEGKSQGQIGSGYFYGKAEKAPFWSCEGALHHVATSVISDLIGLFKQAEARAFLDLLGREVSGSFQFSSSAEGEKGLLELKGDTFRLKLEPEFGKGRVKLKRPASCAFSLSSSLLELFHIPLTLDSPARVEVELETLSLNLEGEESTSPLQAEGSLKVLGVTFSLPSQAKKFAIPKLDLSFMTPEKAGEIRCRASGVIEEGGKEKGSFEAACHLDLNQKSFRLSRGEISLKSLPLALAEPFTKAPLEACLGKELSAHLKQEGALITLTAKTPLFELDPLQFELKEGVFEAKEGRFSYFPPDLKQMVKSSQVSGRISSLLFPLSLRAWRAKYELQLEASEIELQEIEPMGKITLHASKLNLDSSFSDALHLKFSTEIHMKTPSWGQMLFGEKVEIAGKGSASLEEGVATADLSLKGAQVEGVFPLVFEKDAFALQRESELLFNLNRHSLNTLLLESRSLPELRDDAHLKLTLTSGKFPLKGTLSDLSLKGRALLPSLEIECPNHLSHFQLRDTRLAFDFKNGDHLDHFQLEGKAHEKGVASGSFLIHVAKKQASQRLYETFTLSLTDLSTALLGAFSQTRDSLHHLMGPTLSLSFRNEMRGKERELELQLNSQKLQLKGDFVRERHLELRSERNPFCLKWKIDEASSRALRELLQLGKGKAALSPMEIKGEGALILELTRLHLPILPGGFQLKESSFSLQSALTPLTLHELTSDRSASIEDLRLTLDKSLPESEEMRFSIQGKCKEGGRIEGEGALHHYLDQKGQMCAQELSSQFALQITEWPVLFCDYLFSFKADSLFSPSLFLGNQLSASLEGKALDGKGEGAVRLRSSSSLGSLDLSLFNQTLQLTRPFSLSYFPNAQLKAALKKWGSISLQEVEKPLTLWIDEKEGSFSLREASLKGLHIGKAILDIGKVRCDHLGTKSFFQELLQTQEGNSMALWFAPLNFSMKEGRVQMERTELLYQNLYELAFWGQILLPRCYLELILGIPGKTLDLALGIQGIRDHDLLQIPIRGPFNRVKIDKKPALRKIALLLAQKQLGSKRGFLGELMGALGELSEATSKSPPPRRPFPWDHKVSRG